MSGLDSLKSNQLAAGAEFVHYGPAGDDESAAIEIVQTFGAYEAEYAAIRKGAALMDLPQKGVVEVRGADRADFLHRVLTQDIQGLAAGHGTRAFALNNKGRIVADMLVLQSDDQALLVLDRCDVPGLISVLEAYLFSEDVVVRDATLELRVLGLFGPDGWSILNSRSEVALGNGPALGEHQPATIVGHDCVVLGESSTGSTGLILLVPQAGSGSVFESLTGLPGDASDEVDLAAEVTRPGFARPIGWLAFNTARIEAGAPIYHVDFGPDCLPHETGVLAQTVSFTKGCYVGQEVVARMENLGHPKRLLIGLRCAGDELPVARSQVFAQSLDNGTSAQAGEVVGAVTSSTVSPMLGGVGIGLAMVRWGTHEPGTEVIVPVEGVMTSAVVHRDPFISAPGPA